MVDKGLDAIPSLRGALPQEVLMGTGRITKVIYRIRNSSREAPQNVTTVEKIPKITAASWSDWKVTIEQVKIFT